jgi:hypothetical protein
MESITLIHPDGKQEKIGKHLEIGEVGNTDWRAAVGRHGITTVSLYDLNFLG